jgi:PhnB protein
MNCKGAAAIQPVPNLRPTLRAGPADKEFCMKYPSNPIKSLFPYLRVRGAAAAIEFYVAAFGARERFRLVEPSGRIGHCELELGNGVVMLSEEYPEYGLLGPQGAGLGGFSIHLHVDQVDKLAARAVAAGATLLRPPADGFHGERSCSILDPFGHEWLLGQEIESVSVEEMQRRLTALCMESPPIS